MTVPLAINCRFLTQRLTGVQRVAVELCRQIKLLEPSILFLAPKNIIHTEHAEFLEAKVCGKTVGHLWEQFELPAFLKKNGNPLLLSLCNTAPVYYPRNVIMVHDLAWLRNPQWYSKKFYWYYKWMTPRIVKNALRVITGSNFSKGEIVELLKSPSQKVTVIYDAVAQGFSDLVKEGRTLDYDRFILGVSSIEPRKNFHRLIEAFLQAKLENVKLVIAGIKNPAFSNVKFNAALLDKAGVIFAGYKEDRELVALYKKALCFVYPSLYEGFGLPPLEAMLCGCPVVASNIACLSEICGDAAYFVNPNDVNDISSGIRRVVTDQVLRKSLVEKGLRRAASFNWKDSARRLLDVIEGIRED